MKLAKLALIAGATSILALGTLSTTAFAWHPKGTIVKKVQNITSQSALSDADTAATAVTANPGDTLKYVIEISNYGAPHEKGWNDMHFTVMTDTLPAGIELASNPAQREIKENIGHIKAGEKVTKEYLVKVIAKTSGAITNTACFTGDSEVKDAPQKGCNPAVVKVTVPETPKPPVIPENPKVPEAPAPTPEMPAELPKTGASGNIFTGALAIGVAVYATYRYMQSKRELQDNLLNR